MAHFRAGVGLPFVERRRLPHAVARVSESVYYCVFPAGGLVSVVRPPIYLCHMTCFMLLWYGCDEPRARVQKQHQAGFVFFVWGELPIAWHKRRFGI